MKRIDNCQWFSPQVLWANDRFQIEVVDYKITGFLDQDEFVIDGPQFRACTIKKNANFTFGHDLRFKSGDVWVYGQKIIAAGNPVR